MKRPSRSSLTRQPPRRTTLRPVDTYVGYWLRRASNQVSQVLNRKLEDLGITPAEWSVLRELYDGDRRPSALAEKLGLTRGAISKLAERLVSNLLITRQPVPEDEDGRAQMLSLSALGRSVVPVAATVVDANDEEFFGDLDPDARALIVSTMRERVRRGGSGATPAD